MAHQDDIGIHGEVDRLGWPQGEMVSLVLSERKRPCPGGDAAVAEAQMLRQVVKERMATPLGFHGEGEGAVRVDVDVLDRVHSGSRLSGSWQETPLHATIMAELRPGAVERRIDGPPVGVS